ncbi:unnamed protein product [Linum tenue]|uniref:ATPase AAA-type core domain-containing protein n=1 Tax=Linum tenue TaxID=586396 RepID=A0AAV0IIV6_9ROSI|nr:unnamed protein product [Linum tenue]
MGGSSETKVLQELLLYAASAALSCLVLFAGLRHLDPNKDAAKKSLEQKKEIAKRLGRPLIQTNPYEVVVAAVFSLAYKLQPAIIFIDEVDSFLGQRRTSDQEAMTNMKTEFMALWDGFTTDNESVERNIDFNYIASLCDGYTGSDIFELCKKAAYFPIRDLLDEEKKGKKHQASELLLIIYPLLYFFRLFSPKLTSGMMTSWSTCLLILLLYLLVETSVFTEISYNSFLNPGTTSNDPGRPGESSGYIEKNRSSCYRVQQVKISISSMAHTVFGR